MLTLQHIDAWKHVQMVISGRPTWHVSLNALFLSMRIPWTEFASQHAQLSTHFLPRTQQLHVSITVQLLQIHMLTGITTYAYQIVPDQISTCWMVRGFAPIYVLWVFSWRIAPKDVKLLALQVLLNLLPDIVWLDVLETFKLLVITWFATIPVSTVLMTCMLIIPPIYVCLPAHQILSIFLTHWLEIVFFSVLTVTLPKMIQGHALLHVWWDMLTTWPENVWQSVQLSLRWPMVNLILMFASGFALQICMLIMRLKNVSTITTVQEVIRLGLILYQNIVYQDVPQNLFTLA